jgi:hypothetical protein
VGPESDREEERGLRFSSERTIGRKGGRRRLMLPRRKRNDGLRCRIDRERDDQPSSNTRGVSDGKRPGIPK